MLDSNDDLYIDLFPWNKNFETGNATIDSQHRIMIGLLNDLATTLTHEEPNKMNQAFDALVDYTRQHFSDEEAIWSQYLAEDPLFDSHHRHHAAFLPQVEALKAKNVDLPFRVLGIEMVKFLIRWMVFHIIDEDKHLAVIVDAMQKGESLDEAKATAESTMFGSVGILIESMMLMYDNLSARTLSLLRERNERIRLEQELTDTNKRLVELSVTDQLTGLNNRRNFNKIFDSELKRDRRDKHYLNLILLDIDHFKSLNDTYGHAEGDLALQAVARCLQQTCRRPNDFAFRIGGEEFAVICSGDKPEDAVTFAEMIRKNIEALKIPNKESSVCDYLTVSVGVAAISPTEAVRQLEDYFKVADKNLYTAKDSGRNNVVMSGNLFNP